MNREQVRLGYVCPPSTEATNAPIHKAHDETRFLAQRFCGGFTLSYNIMRIQRTFRQLSCSRDNKRRLRIRCNDSVRKTEQARLGRWSEFGCHVGARNWIQPVLQQVPTLQDTDVASVEI